MTSMLKPMLRLGVLPIASATAMAGDRGDSVERHGKRIDERFGRRRDRRR